MSPRKIAIAPMFQEILQNVRSDWAERLLHSARTDDVPEPEQFMLPMVNHDLLEEIAKSSQFAIRELEEVCASILDQADDLPDRLSEALAPDHLVEVALSEYRDCKGQVERSVWRYLFAQKFFDTVDRTHRLRNFRDVAKLYSAFGLDTPAAFEATAFDAKVFGESIVRHLNLSEGCDVEIWQDPPDDDGASRYLIAITTAGQFTSVRTYAKGNGKGHLTYLLAREIIISYAPSTGIIEVCSSDSLLRHQVAERFAADALGVDLATEPLTWRVYSLWPLHRNLELDVPPDLAGRVSKACVVEIGITMGMNGQSLTLKTKPGEEAVRLAPRLMKAASGLAGAGRITHVKIHVAYWKSSGKSSSFGITVAGKNACSIANQRDPDRRRLGEVLLTRWRILERFRDLRPEELSRELTVLLALLEDGKEQVDRDALDRLGADVMNLSRAALVRRRGIEDVQLIDTGEEPLQSGEVGDNPRDDQVNLDAIPGSAVARVPKAFVEFYSLDINRIVQKVTTFLDPVGRTGRITEEVKGLWRIGTVAMGERNVPAWIATRLDDAEQCGKVDRRLREMPNLVNGIVFSAGDTPFMCLATHPVVPITGCISGEGDDLKIDATAVADAYARAIMLAKAGEAVAFKKWSPGLAQLIVPGQVPWVIDTITRVTVVENLVNALRAGAPGLSLAETMKGTGMASPQPAFGKDWKDIKGKYIDNRTRALWSIVTEPRPT